MILLFYFRWYFHYILKLFMYYTIQVAERNSHTENNVFIRKRASTADYQTIRIQWRKKIRVILPASHQFLSRVHSNQFKNKLVSKKNFRSSVELKPSNKLVINKHSSLDYCEKELKSMKFESFRNSYDLQLNCRF